MNRYHFHLYFTPDEEKEALEVQESARLSSLFDSVVWFEKAVGPHPSGMVEGRFDERAYPPALAWLEKHRGNFSVLVHLDSGDDLKDHTEGALWLGPEVKLDFNFFELIVSDPSLRIHPQS